MLWNILEFYIIMLCADTLASIDRVKKVARSQTDQMCNKCSEVKPMTDVGVKRHCSGTRNVISPTCRVCKTKAILNATERRAEKGRINLPHISFVFR